MYEDENYDIWETIADESNMEEEIIEKLSNNEPTKEELKQYLNLPFKEFEKLPKNIKDMCMTDELLEEFENTNEVDKYHQHLFINMIRRKYPTQLDRVRKYFYRYYSDGNYGEKRYAHKYHKRNVPIDYDYKAKFILDNLKTDYPRYKNCLRVKDGKKSLIPVGMTYDELLELASNMNCLSNALKNTELKNYHGLIVERFLKGISIREYAKKHNMAKGSVEHQTKKARYIFAGLLARYDLAQAVFDEIFEEQAIDLQEIENQAIKDQIFTLLESSGILERLH